MTKRAISLDVIDVREPCPASWEQMRGGERVRYCEQCALHVYDLSAMTRREAEDLVNAHEGRLCVRFHRRTDGKVVTADCATLQERLRRATRKPMRAALRAWAAAGTLAAAIGLTSGCDNATCNPVIQGATMMPAEIGEPVMGDVAPAQEHVMGKVRATPDQSSD